MTWRDVKRKSNKLIDTARFVPLLGLVNSSAHVYDRTKQAYMRCSEDRSQHQSTYISKGLTSSAGSTKDATTRWRSLFFLPCPEPLVAQRK